MAQKVTQGQTALSRPEGTAAVLDCSYETNVTFYDLYWYKQLFSGEMVLLIIQSYSGVYSTITGNYSVNFQKEAKRISLTISPVQMEDFATYFCAFLQSTVLQQTVKAEQKLRSSLSIRPCCRR